MFTDNQGIYAHRGTGAQVQVTTVVRNATGATIHFRSVKDGKSAHTGRNQFLKRFVWVKGKRV